MALAPATGGKGKRGSRRAEPVRQRYTLGTVGLGWRSVTAVRCRTPQGDGSEVLVASALAPERLGCGHGLTERVAAEGFDAVSRSPSESLAGFVGIFGSASPEAASRPTSLDSTGRG
jgi:hypothetical protein